MNLLRAFWDGTLPDRESALLRRHGCAYHPKLLIQRSDTPHSLGRLLGDLVLCLCDDPRRHLREPPRAALPVQAYRLRHRFRNLRLAVERQVRPCPCPFRNRMDQGR